MRLGSAPPLPVHPRFRSGAGSAQALRFRITGSVRMRLRCRPSCTSSLQPGQTLPPTLRITLWAARARAREAPRRGALAAALDSKSPRFAFIKGESAMAADWSCCSPVGYINYIQLDAEDAEGSC